MNSPIVRLLPVVAALLTGVLGLAIPRAGIAASTDIADVPLFTSSAVTVKPNIMFILDDSGSMGNDYLPDDANFALTKYGKLTSQCNGVAYNPSITYSPPLNSATVDADGTPQAAPNGDLTVVNSDPNVRFASFSSRSPASTTSLVVVASGSVSVVFSSAQSPQNNWYSNGQQISIFSSSDTSSYIEGVVSNWNRTTRTLTITVTSAVGTGNTLSNPKVVVGGSATYYNYIKSTGKIDPMSYTYTASGVNQDTFWTECNYDIGTNTTVFQKVTVTQASTDAQNYANWYAYYRTRMLMMKASVSRAFKNIGDRYRVGYTTISQKTAVAGAKFVDVDTFGATQKTLFYTKLFAANPGSYTPLRGALSKAGHYFANKASGQTKDPVQYSCQKNFTILSTDGYWNTHDESSTYTALGLDEQKVGQQDAGTTPRPKKDGTIKTTTKKVTWNVVETVDTQTATTVRNYSNRKDTKVDTYTPTTGTKTTSYTSLGTYSPITNSTFAQSCALDVPTGKQSCTVTVTLASTPSTTAYPSGYIGPITSTAASPYGGTLTVLSWNQTTKQYTYKLPLQSSVPTLPTTTTNKGTSFYSPYGCTSGQLARVVSSVAQTDAFTSASTTTRTADATDVTSYSNARKIYTTPYTWTQVFVDDVLKSDTGDVAGTTTNAPGTAPTPPANTSVTGPAYSTVVSSSTGTSAPPGYTASALPLPSPNNPACASNTTATVETGKAPLASAQTVTTNLTAPTAPASGGAVGSPVASIIYDNTVSGRDAAVAAGGTSTDAITGGSSNSLADVAMYYFNTDLRTSGLTNCTGALGTGTDVCGTATALDEKQNMVTFTLGLGANGTLKYKSNYATKPAESDFQEIIQGTKFWPIPADTDSGGDPTNIDDLWHAAVNGGGQYFSANNPQEVVTSLENALKSIDEKTGTASAAATSTLQPVDGDNDIFVAQFTSGKWFGNVLKYTIDPTKGTISSSAAWRAADQLRARIAAGTARTVYYFKPTTAPAGALHSFDYATLTADGYATNFDNFCSKTGASGSGNPSQCASLTGTDLTTANSGSALVSYLLGTETSVFRSRSGTDPLDNAIKFQPLGDIINSSPIYVGAPKFKYTENNYTDFATKTLANGGASDRAGVLYVGSNDGMLHAFDRKTGDEKWAFIPSSVLPKLYKLADNNYDYNHQFLVDGSPQIGDVFDGTKWHTILVGGMNKGGRTFFALDITNPDTPKALWEFTDNNLGLTYGNPVITKRKDGTWVVAFASGYNNVSPGDGNGHLFVLNALTGAQITGSPFATMTTAGAAAGTTSTPSGLAKINAFIESEIDNTTKVFYGGDLLGNVWRFDLDSQVKPFAQAFQFAQLKDGSTPQSITTKPILAEINFKGSTYPIVYVGTGRYLGTADLSNTDLQSVYALKDIWSDTGLGDVRSDTTMVTQTLSSATSKSGLPIRTASANAVDWSSSNGWLVDFNLDPKGERVNVNMQLTLNVLSVATNVPTSDACDAGGQSWLYKLDIGTGSAVSNANDGAAGISLGKVLVAGQTVVQLSNGDTVTISTLSNSTLRTDSQPPPPAPDLLRRTSWRELAN